MQPRAPSVLDLPPIGNRILDSLPVALRAPLEDRLVQVPLTRTAVLFDAQTIPDAVHFPVDAVISLVTPLLSGAAVEVASIGNEGVVGMPFAIDGGQAAVRAVVRVPGRALRIGATELASELEARPTLGDSLLRYTDVLFNQIAQAAACHRFHPTVERLSRLLLMTQDHLRRDNYPVTHEAMAQMLGSRRATVTLAAGVLQDMGLIRISRGRVTIVDRAGLEAAACECYGSITRGRDNADAPSGAVMRHTSARLRRLSEDNARLAQRLEELTAQVHRLSAQIHDRTRRA